MAGPGDEIAAAEGRSRSELRASHADREQVIEVLKAAFVQGRLAIYLFVLAMTLWLGGAVMVESWLKRRTRLR
jgi:hypothetical protein